MAKEKAKIPYGFVLDMLTAAEPRVRPMFGAHAIYIGEMMVLMLRDKKDADSGIWIASKPEHHASMQQLFPAMRKIGIFGDSVVAWRMIPDAAPTFEADATMICEMILRGDPRIGKIPKPKKPKTAAKKPR